MSKTKRTAPAAKPAPVAKPAGGKSGWVPPSSGRSLPGGSPNRATLRSKR